MNTTKKTGKIQKLSRKVHKSRGHLNHKIFSENPIYDPLNIPNPRWTINIGIVWLDFKGILNYEKYPNI